MHGPDLPRPPRRRTSALDNGQPPVRARGSSRGEGRPVRALIVDDDDREASTVSLAAKGSNCLTDDAGLVARRNDSGYAGPRALAPTLDVEADRFEKLFTSPKSPPADKQVEPDNQARGAHRQVDHRRSSQSAYERLARPPRASRRSVRGIPQDLDYPEAPSGGTWIRRQSTPRGSN